MINYPNALQPPPSGIKLPERFLQLTQATNQVPNSVLRTNGTSNGTTDGANSTLSLTATNASLSGSTTDTLLIDPHFNSSLNNASFPTNVGQHVLNGEGEVDGSDIGLGKSVLNGAVNEPGNQSLNTGAIVGIAIGGLAAFAILIVMAVLVRKIRKNSREKKTESGYIPDNTSSSIQYYHEDSNSTY